MSCPQLRVSMNTKRGSVCVNAALDTGCEMSLATETLLANHNVKIVRDTVPVRMLDGTRFRTLGKATLHIVVSETCRVELHVLVVKYCSIGTSLVLGSDFIKAVGGVSLLLEGNCLSVAIGKVPPVLAAGITSGKSLTLKEDGYELTFDPVQRKWSLQWIWKDKPPDPIDPKRTVGEYQVNTSDTQRQLYLKELQQWMDNGWLVKHEHAKHGPICHILPLMPRVQEHKKSTPVRPVLDYRRLNSLIAGTPGADALACDETLRKWRKFGDRARMLDIKKAYLQVHVASEQLKYQGVKINGELYVLTRMGFGFKNAPRAMNQIVHHVIDSLCRGKEDLREDGVDNFVDDIYVDENVRKVSVVQEAFESYGLPLKPAKDIDGSHVLGMKISRSQSRELIWNRRDDFAPIIPKTKRELFSVCGTLTAHYPVCGFLRMSCSWLKRLASSYPWDKELPSRVATLCKQLISRVKETDPAHGLWSVSADEMVRVWCDASEYGIGVVLESDRTGVIEDGSWLRKPADTRHINVAELEAVMKGIALASKWGFKKLKILTDSKTVLGWLRQVLNNTYRVRVGGLYETVIKRRLEIITDTLTCCAMEASVDYVASADNKADEMTRVPQNWLQKLELPVIASGNIQDCVHTQQIDILDVDGLRQEQFSKQSIMQVRNWIQSITDELPKSNPFYTVRSQLELCSLPSCGLVVRKLKVPPNEQLYVPLTMNKELVESVVSKAHIDTGHSNWEAVWREVRQKLHYPKLAELIQQFCASCERCCASNPMNSTPKAHDQCPIPSRPWEIVHADTLTIPGHDHFIGVLVMFDMFTKWSEVIPIRSHRAEEIAQCIISACYKWGPMTVLRCDNGREMVNHITTKLFDRFGVKVLKGAVRHPQSQGGAERFHRTFLGLVRKVLDDASEWPLMIDSLLYSYRTRHCSAIGMSPMLAMCGWTPRTQSPWLDNRCWSTNDWVSQQQQKRAVMSSLIEECLSEVDREWKPPLTCHFSVGDSVLYRSPERSPKVKRPWETGWTVTRIITPTTVEIDHAHKRGKITNVDLLKLPSNQWSNIIDIEHSQNAQEKLHDYENPLDLVAVPETAEEYPSECVANELVPDIGPSRVTRTPETVDEYSSERVVNELVSDIRPARATRRPEFYGMPVNSSEAISDSYDDDDIIWRYENGEYFLGEG